MAGEPKEVENLLDSIIGDSDPTLKQQSNQPEDDDLEDDEPTTEPVEDSRDDSDDNPDDTDEEDTDNEGRDETYEQSPRRQESQARDNPRSKAVDPFDLKKKPTTDRQGNVFIDGKLVAKAGREARMYASFRRQALADRQDAAKLAQHVNQIAYGAKELLARYDQLQKQKTLLDQVGLDPKEQLQLVQIAQAYKKSPIEGIKMLLTQAHLAGVDIKSLGVSGAFDPKALVETMKGEMTELLKPVLQETSQRVHQNSARNEAVGFFQRNPRAREVARIVGGSDKLGLMLKEAKRRAPNLSLDELFERLDYALLSNGMGQPATGPVEGPRPNRRAAKRMEKNFARSVRPASDSFEDIAKSVLRDVARVEARGQ